MKIRTVISLEGNKIFQISSFISKNKHKHQKAKTTIIFNYHKSVHIVLAAELCPKVLWVGPQEYGFYQETYIFQFDFHNGFSSQPTQQKLFLLDKHMPRPLSP
jgi:hypothetical protein